MTHRQALVAGLFSLLLSAVSFLVATEALAGCVFNPVTRRYDCTATGGSINGGSTIISFIINGDMNVGIAPTENAPGFLDTQMLTTDGQRIDCTYDDGVTVENAKCETSFTCRRFKIGDCVQQGNKPGTRTSVMSCPTTTGAGCTGDITVYFSDPNKAPVTKHFEVDHNLATNQQCFSEFPTSSDLGKGVIGKLVQTGCVRGAEWNVNEPVSQHVVRNDLEPNATTFQSNTKWLGASQLLCAQNSGYPTGACSNEGGVWVTVPNPNPQGSAQACIDAQSQLTCGQQVVVVDGQKTILDGPAPSECKMDNEGQCTCRCARCNERGTLVNLGETTGLFVLANPSATPAWAAFCEVTVTGN